MVYALSRRQEKEEEEEEEEKQILNALSVAEPTWMQEIAHNYGHDPAALQLLIELINDPSTKPSYTLHQGIIRYNQKIL